LLDFLCELCYDAWIHEHQINLHVLHMTSSKKSECMVFIIVAHVIHTVSNNNEIYSISQKII